MVVMMEFSVILMLMFLLLGCCFVRSKVVRLRAGREKV